jgi:hypothetical protein
MNLQVSRRVLLVRGASVSASALAWAEFAAAAPARVDEADETAVALGYKHDTAKIDQQRFPKHSPAQNCGNCSFFQGAANDAWAGCAMFGRKHIAAAGWCNAWAKKPG